MSDLVAMTDEARGPLSGIGDDVTRRELGKLWTTLEGRLPANGKKADPHTLVTHADLTRTEADLSRRLEAMAAATRAAAPTAQGGVGVTGNAGLLTANNTWSGTNEYRNDVMIYAHAAGPLFVPADTTVLLGPGYTAALDVQRTTDVGSGDAAWFGGASALLIQHRAYGTATSALTAGLRCNMDTRQSSPTSSLNFTTAAYLSMLNYGTSVSAFGLLIEAYNRALGGDTPADPMTAGISVRMYRSEYTLVGKQVGFLLKSSSATGWTGHTDYGFLASPDASGPTPNIHYPFSVGSNWIGPLRCQVAFDAAYARPDLAAFRMRKGDQFVMDGPDDNAWNMTIASDYWRVRRGGGALLSVRPSGDVVVEVGDLVINNPRGRAPSPALPSATEQDGLKHFGYFRLELGGFSRWVPFYGYYA